MSSLLKALGFTIGMRRLGPYNAASGSEFKAQSSDAATLAELQNGTCIRKRFLNEALADLERHRLVEKSGWQRWRLCEAALPIVMAEFAAIREAQNKDGKKEEKKKEEKKEEKKEKRRKRSAKARRRRRKRNRVPGARTCCSLSLRTMSNEPDFCGLREFGDDAIRVIDLRQPFAQRAEIHGHGAIDAPS